MRSQCTPTTLPAQSNPKSVQDMTPFELSQVNQFQDRNRGFGDDEDRDLTTRFSLDDGYGYYELED